ncbi:hypothetical protein PV327_002996 [Microctonus hyperodae]|uniref:Cytochrome c oxidase assembly protein COX20, mitochondrial n=1 Tax=Microctonus hyperodae TaxID=165561 RepID=A0AA39G3F6_MICHY|nr:hypothetical protein PV327_002996 [Microctonus hyperodae]
MNDGTTDDSKSLIIFGRDVSKIPCFKYSWIYGITSGIGAGLLTFMFTSRPQLASHTMVGTICTVTLTYFGFCRYKSVKDAATTAQIKTLMQEAFSGDKEEREKKINDITELKKV